jgi:WD40 repeat protein
VKAVVFSLDGTQIASASGDGTVRVWDAPAHTPSGPGEFPMK